MCTNFNNDLTTTVSQAINANPNIAVKMLIIYLNSKLNAINLLFQTLICMVGFSIINGFAFVFNIFPNKTFFCIILVVVLAVLLMTLFLYDKFEDVIEEDFKKYLMCISATADDDTFDDDDDEDESDIDMDEDDEDIDIDRILPVADNKLVTQV